MAFLHSLDREMPKFHLNSRHVLIDSVSDNELCARLNMAGKSTVTGFFSLGTNTKISNIELSKHCILAQN